MPMLGRYEGLLWPGLYVFLFACLNPHRTADDLFSLHTARKLFYYRPLVHHIDAVTHTQDFWQFRGDHENGMPGICQPVHEGMNISLGSYVNSPGRFVKDEQPGSGGEALGDDHLLLIAATQVLDFTLEIRWLNLIASFTATPTSALPSNPN